MPAPFRPINIAGSYFAGRNQADEERAADQRNTLGNLAIDRERQFNALAGDPNTTADQYARAGHSDVANALTGQQNRGMKMDEVKMGALKQIGSMAAQALNSQNPRALVQSALSNPAYQQVFAAAGVDPSRIDLNSQSFDQDLRAWASLAEQKDTGPLEAIVGKDGNPTLATRGDAVGKTPYRREPTGQGAPSGYNYNPDGSLSPIKGGPADPNNQSTKDKSRIFQMADKLRDEFNAASKEFISVGDNYNVVKRTASDHSAAGDLSMIFAYMKMLDPNSVVREQEFANAQNAAGVPERVQNAWNKALNGERLNETQRADFIRQAKNLYETRKQRNKSVTDRYTSIAKRNGVNPDDVVGDMAAFEEPAQGVTPPSAPAEQTATGPNGQKIVLRNGQWVPL